jgi:type I site-specific restriction endonuclease
MNEAETGAELIDPALAAAGWGVVEGSKILREYRMTAISVQPAKKFDSKKHGQDFACGGQRDEPRYAFPSIGEAGL